MDTLGGTGLSQIHGNHLDVDMVLGLQLLLQRVQFVR